MNHKQAAFSSVILLLLLGAATGAGYIFRYLGFPETNIVIIYILSVIITSRLTPSYLYGIVSSVAATFSFNYFFTDPYFTFSVYDPSYIITFIIMTITAIITSALTSRVMKSALEAKEKEAETSALYNLTNRLTNANDINEIIKAAVGAISDLMNCNAACLYFNNGAYSPSHREVSGLQHENYYTGGQSPAPLYIQQRKPGKLATLITPNLEEVNEIKLRIDGLRADFDTNEDFYDFPIMGRDSILGIIRIPRLQAGILYTRSDKQIKTLRSMIENTALAMDRFNSEQEQIKSREETEKERYRGNLLRAISHDLRTPLTGILGASKMLKDAAANKEAVIKIAQGIYEEADWLHSLVENILNLTRIQDGKLLPKKEPEAAEEIIGSSISNIKRRYPDIKIEVCAPCELLVIPVDARLISQVLINLLDNSVKHSATCITITLTEEKDVSADIKYARFSVSDNGEGIRSEDLPNIFTMFYTTKTKHPDAKHGIGLGLPICRAIIKAHGGEISARNKTDGAEIIFTLPMEDMQNGS